MKLIRLIKPSRRNRVAILVLIVLMIPLFIFVKEVLGASATWTNGGGDGLWSNCSNWSGGTGAGGCPGTGDIATFNGTSTANVNVNTAVDVAGISITSAYSGQITQNNSVTIGTSGFVQDGGTWNGGSQAFDVNDGSFTVSGGIHTATTGTWTIERDFTHSAGTLNTDSATLTLNGGFGDSSTLTCSATISGNVDFNKTSSGATNIGSNCTIGGNFTRTDGIVNNPGSAYTLTVGGNFSISQTEGFGGANLTLKMAPSSGTKTVTRNDGTFASKFNVEASGGAVVQLSSYFVTSSTCNVVEGVFDINSYEFDCGSTFTVEDGGSLKLVGSEYLTPPTLNSGSTVIYKGDGDSLADTYQINKSWGIHNLTIASTDSNDTFDAGFTLGTGLAGHWKMDEASWTNDCSTLTVGDSTANNNDGKSCPAGTGPSTAAGSFGNAGDFDGNEDYVDLSHPASLNLSSAFSVSAWVNLDALPEGAGAVAELWTGGSDRIQYTLGFGVDDGTSSNAGFGFYTGSAWALAEDTVAIGTGSWILLTGTWDGTNLRLMKNGEYVGGRTPGTSTAADAESIVIGRRHDLNATRDYFPGLIDDVRIYDRALSFAEAGNIYEDSTGTTSSLDINGNFTLTSGIFTAPDGDFTIGGGFAHSGGTFTHNSGTVIFDDATQTAVISGTTTFNNFKSTTAGETLQFVAGATQTINGLLTITGTSGNRITIHSGTETSQWIINHQGTESITYTSIHDSGCDAGSTEISLNGTNTNGGNNDSCWDFNTFVPKINGKMKFSGRLCFGACPTPAGPQKFEFYSSGDDGQSTINGSFWKAQTFTPSVSHTVTSVKLLLYKAAGSPGTVTVSIMATDGSGHPTGADLASGTTDGNTLPTGAPYEWREISLGAGTPLTSGTKYAIVVRALDGDSSNQIAWRYDGTSPAYSDGNRESATIPTPGTWTADLTRDYMFEDWGN